MKLFIYIFVILTSSASAVEKNTDQSVGKEVYVVVIYKVSQVRAPKNRTSFKATITEVVTGSKKVSDQIEFERVFEVKPKDLKAFLGRMYFLVYDKAPMNGSPIEGEFYVDVQSPYTFIKFSPKRLRLWRSEGKAKAK